MFLLEICNAEPTKLASDESMFTCDVNAGKESDAISTPSSDILLQNSHFCVVISPPFGTFLADFSSEMQRSDSDLAFEALFSHFQRRKRSEFGAQTP